MDFQPTHRFHSDLDGARVAVVPMETGAVLAVDADAVLPGAVAGNVIPNAKKTR